MLTSEAVPGTDLVEAVVDGEVGAAPLAELRQRLQEVAQQHGGVRVLVEVRRLSGVQPKALREDLKAFGLLTVLRRYAVVTASAPLRTAARGAFAVIPVEGRLFEHRAEARAWLDS